MRRVVGLSMLGASASLVGCGGQRLPTPGSILTKQSVVIAAQNDQTFSAGNAKVITQANTFDGLLTPMTLETAVPYRVPQGAFASAVEMIVISTPATPRRSIVVRYPVSGTGPCMAAQFEGNELVGALPATVASGEATVVVPPTALTRGRGSGFAIGLVFGMLTLANPRDTQARLERVAGPGEGSSVVVVHGMLQSADDVRALATEARRAGSYDSAYLYHYDYRLPFAACGRALADLLGSGGFPRKSVDIIAYSKGGLVARHALETCNATASVRRLITLATPHTGCRAELAGLYYGLGGLYLGSVSALPLPDIGDVCLSELMPSSDALVHLNSYRNTQNGDVDYWLFSGGRDWVVTHGSAQAEGTWIGTHTNGSLRQTVLPTFGHTGMYSVQAVSQAYRLIRSASGGLEISFDSSHVEPSPWDGCWYRTITVTNRTGTVVTLDSLQFDTYGSSGSWSGHQWFSPTTPPGEFFPSERTPWGVTLGSGSSTALDVQTWINGSKDPVWAFDAAVVPRTCHHILIATGEDGTVYKVERDQWLTYNGVWPASPLTRSRGRAAGGLHSLTAAGPGTMRRP